MYHKISSFIAAVPHYYAMARAVFLQYWKRALVLLIVIFIIAKKDITIGFQLNRPVPEEGGESFFSSLGDVFYARPVANERTEGENAANDRRSVPELTSTRNENSDKKTERKRRSSLNLAELPFLREKDDKKREEKRRKQLKYVREYANIAQREREEFGIPASITLAQGLLESNAGESGLAKRNKNHFGIKCFSKTCAKGHCSNFSDDHHKDFFRIYSRPEDSFRSHSEVLKKERYQHLYKLDQTDYIGWSYGLKKAGYATDKYYAEKLIYIIEDLALYYYDD